MYESQISVAPNSGVYFCLDDSPNGGSHKVWTITTKRPGENDQVVRMKGKPTPLGFDDLVKFSILKERVNLRFTGSVQSDAETNVIQGDVLLEWEPAWLEKPVFLFTNGGWLPAGPWIDAEFLLLDRNILIDIEKLVTQEDGDLEQRRKFWFDLLKMTNAKIQLLTLALEGGVARTPGMAEFGAEVCRANNVLDGFFGTENIVKIDAARERGAAGLIKDLSTYLKKTYPFLRNVLPLLNPRPKASRHESVYRNILEAANQAGLGAKSVMTLLAVSHLFQGSAQRNPASRLNPGQRILKSNNSFTDRDLYNASFDAGLVELLSIGNTLSNSGIVLATQDKGLASLWAGLQPFNFRMENGIPNADLKLIHNHFPAMPNELFIDFSKHFQ